MNLCGLCNGDHLAVEFAVRDSEDDVDGVIDTQKAGVDHEVVSIAGSPDLVVYSGEGGATISLAWIGNGGVMIFLAGVIGGLIQGASLADMCRVMGNTCKSMWKAITTIVFIIAVAKVMGYSGMTSSIATLLAALTGSFFPALAPVVGIIGTFVTGSTTSSGILFAKMQTEVAQQIGANAIQLVAANMAGGAIGKLISPQSIAVAIAAIGLDGADGKIMSQTVKYCVVFGIIVCVISYVSAVLL